MENIDDVKREVEAAWASMELQTLLFSQLINLIFRVANYCCGRFPSVLRQVLAVYMTLSFPSAYISGALR